MACSKSVMPAWGVTDYRVVGRAVGAAFDRQLLQHLSITARCRSCLAITSPGGRHRCRAYGARPGMDDYIVGQRYGLPVDNPVGGNGCFVAGTPLFEASMCSRPTSM